MSTAERSSERSPNLRRITPPDEIPRLPPDTLRLGRTFIPEALGISWSMWLSWRGDGRDTPTASWIGGRIYYSGNDWNEWLDRCRETGRGAA